MGKPLERPCSLCARGVSARDGGRLTACDFCAGADDMENVQKQDVKLMRAATRGFFIS